MQVGTYVYPRYVEKEKLTKQINKKFIFISNHLSISVNSLKIKKSQNHFIATS